MHRGYEAEGRNGWSVTGEYQSYPIQRENRVIYREYYVPSIELKLPTHGDTPHYTNFPGKQRVGRLAKKDHPVSFEHVNDDKYGGGRHVPIEGKPIKEYGKGDYLDHVSRLEKMPSEYIVAHAPNHVQKHNDMPENQVMYEEYEDSEEEYDSDTQEIVKKKVITRIEKRTIKW